MATPCYSPHQIGELPFEQTSMHYPKQQQIPASSSSLSMNQNYHSRFRYHAQPQSQASIQLYDSYFPPQPQASTSKYEAQSQVQTNNVDEIIYRYSSEFDRVTTQAPGTPTVGIYSQDGLWDDEDVDFNPQSKDIAGTTGSSSSRKNTLTDKKNNRSGTIYSGATAPGEAKGWTWRRPSMSQSHSPSIATEEQVPLPMPIPPKALEKKKSKGLLRGKGRRGELSVQVPSDPDESFEAPPPLPIPATPASFITESTPASYTSSTLSPMNYPSPILDTPSMMSTPPLTAASTSTNKSSKAASSWKRGMQKIFKSKSSIALREAAQREASLSPPPPMPSKAVPNLPSSQPANRLGKPFSSSTPPTQMDQQRTMENAPMHSAGYLSTPPSATTDTFVTPLFPNFPTDPFASSLDLTCNNPTPSPSVEALRPSLRHNSPSLRDLKNFLPNSSKPAILKAKSFATLHHREDHRSTAPLATKEKVQSRTNHSGKLSKRMSSLVGLNVFAHSAPERAATTNLANLEQLERPPTQASLAPPIESPPLLPPQPPYFASASRSPSLPSITTDSSSSPEESPRLSVLPPSAPLPPIPASSSSSNLTAPIQRSGSGAVLLPRSRSTSMSFKSPPTSSSFFDLYEQLGIWPSAEKDKKEIHEESGEISAVKDQAIQDPQLGTETKTTTAVEDDKENISPPSDAQSSIEMDLEHAVDITEDASHLQANMPRSDTNSSIASWNVALNSFPTAPGGDVLDFGLPYVADEEGLDSMVASTQPHDQSDALSIVAVAASSRNSSHQTTVDNSMSTDKRGSGSTVTHATSVGMSYLASSSSSKHRGRGRASGSGNSSRESTPPGSRDHRTDHEQVSEESEDDDVPLSKLHPEAAAAQIQRRETKKKIRQARKYQDAQAVVEKKRKEKTQGRNPGGGTDWDGEGGIPPEILFKKLEVVVTRRAERQAAIESRIGEQAAAFGQVPGLKAHRSLRENVPPPLDHGVRRAHSQGHAHAAQVSPTWKDAPAVPPIQNAIPHRHPYQQAPFNPESAISPTNTSFGRIPSAKLVDPDFTIAMHGHDRVESSASHNQGQAYPTSNPMGGYDRSRQNSVATSVSSRLPPAPTGTRAPSRQDDLPTMSAQVTRSNTAATQHSIASSAMPRVRAHTNAISPITQEPLALHMRSTTEPIPAASTSKASSAAPTTHTYSTHQTSSTHVAHATATTVSAGPAQRVHATVPAFISALNGKKIMLDLTSTTTAREVLVNTYHQGDLVDASVGKSWVLCEIFAEMGCERQIREYEPLLPIVKGWDSTAKFNCFVFKQSNRGMPTWARAVPTNPPMLGQWVQYEAKKGKWTKKWLETRGGQVFLAKNEKNKDEVHFNTLFFDIYAITRGYDSPRPSTFMLKRVEPAANFEDPQDYAHVFSCDEGIAFKLMAAIYDAKSYTIAQNYPQMINQQIFWSSTSASSAHSSNPNPNPNSHTHSGGSGSIRKQSHTINSSGPLVSLVNDDQERKSGFTGKGLLKI
ncbi:uncharacterized protein I303_101681 [Kwoniella dejecticola CBS 10117]|uniref:PH domain-containing protein n=1 Tax=Kwoniella dejecticola CBS 10117 TaxID=1296121 RepID=A0A1A6AD23_9TREE|nr:uncharacterized protein I303_02183 [Kwoniella dejecticola CBS 10117]OBR87967.1 hypothetical protein I303_02183 [Kwoniella dejecticola CBS 10117]